MWRLQAGGCVVTNGLTVTNKQRIELKQQLEITLQDYKAFSRTLRNLY